MNTRSVKVREIFDQAAEITSEQERSTFLDATCAGDAELRSQVEALLKAYFDAGTFLDRPALDEIISPSDAQTEAFESTPSEAVSPITPTQVDSHGESAEFGFLATPTTSESIGRLEHYEILEVIGKGGFGTVFKANDTKLRRIVAIKVLATELAANGSARKRFIREAQTAAAVKNEHVVAIYNVGDDAPLPFLVMEIIDGISLQDKIDKKGPLSLKEILRIGMQAAEGLAAAHKQGLVHRDIKPANILLENGVERVKITDFGLARAVDDASVTQSGTVAGTPMYMSPEQAEGLQIDHRSDLFSLGTVLYAMCTGHPPFRATGTMAVLKRVIEDTPRPIREINNEIPDWLCDIIAKLHAKKPEDRFQMAKEVAELLGQHLAHLQQPHVAPRPAPVTMVAATPISKGEIVLPVLNVLGQSFRIYCVFVVTMSALLTLGMWLFGWHGMTVVRVLFPVFVFFAVASWGLSTWMTRSSRPRWGAAFWQAAATLGAAAFGLGVTIVFEWIAPLPQPIDVPNGNSFTPVFGGPGWRQLYDGKSYAGWKPFGNSNAGRGEFLLFSDGGVETVETWPRIFNLHMEVLLVHGQGTVRFHTVPRGQNEPQDGWWLTFTEESDGKIKAELSAVNPDDAKDVNEFPAINVGKCGEWFHVEIIANQHRTDVRINGRETMELKHANNVPVAGVLRLWNNGRRNIDGKGQDSQIAFRNIEIKSHLLKDGTEPGWVQLFNGKDLTGWKQLHPDKAKWKIVDGVLIGTGERDFLHTIRDDFENFHLRFESKIMAGDRALLFRAKGSDEKGIDGYQLETHNSNKDLQVSLSSNKFGPLQTEFLPGAAADLSGQAADWHNVDIIAKGHSIQVLVNGKQAIGFEDMFRKYGRGYIGVFLGSQSAKSAKFTFAKSRSRSCRPRNSAGCSSSTARTSTAGCR